MELLFLQQNFNFSVSAADIGSYFSASATDIASYFSVSATDIASYFGEHSLQT